MHSNGRVSGKVAFITGASLGIGRETALLLASEGASVAVTDVKEHEGLLVVDEITRKGGRAAYWHLDVSNETQVAAVAVAIKERFGPITILVNNAGISGANKPTHLLSSDEWDLTMSIDLKGVFFCSKHVLPQMMDVGKGSIINMSSIYGLVGAGDIPAYHAAKGAVRIMSKNDAIIYAKNGIRVNSVHPGFIITPMVEGFLAEGGDVTQGKAALDALHPIGHAGEPLDIAYGILYLASDESKFVTGSELVIDGGYTAK